MNNTFDGVSARNVIAWFLIPVWRGSAMVYGFGISGGILNRGGMQSGANGGGILNRGGMQSGANGARQ